MGFMQSHLIHTPTTTPSFPPITNLFSPPLKTHHHQIKFPSDISISLPSPPLSSSGSILSPSLFARNQSQTTTPQIFEVAVQRREVNMAAMNSSVLACNYALSAASDSNLRLMPPASVASTTSTASPRLPVIRAQQVKSSEPREGATEGRRGLVLGLAAALFATAAVSSSANAGVIDEYLEKSKANKELNDKKRLATSGANFARAYTVEFGSCKFPENFTGCQDLAKQKKVPFISDDLALECEGKDKYKCGSNVFWKW